MIDQLTKRQSRALAKLTPSDAAKRRAAYLAANNAHRIAVLERAAGLYITEANA